MSSIASGKQGQTPNVVVVDAATVVPVRIDPTLSGTAREKVVLNFKDYNLTEEAQTQLKDFNWEFKSKLQVLLGQSEVVNWVRSESPDKVSLMRYGGEWKLPGGSKDHGETMEQTAIRELSEEFDVAVPKEAVLRPFRVNSTRVIQGKSYRMWNFVCLADENEWLNNIDVAALNRRLLRKRNDFFEKYAKNGSPFWKMNTHDREKVSPEVYQVSWMNLSDIIDTYLNSKHAPGALVPTNSFQAEEFAKHGVKSRDPMYATMTTIRALEDAGTFDAIRKISTSTFNKEASRLAKKEAATQQWDAGANTRMTTRFDQKL